MEEIEEFNRIVSVGPDPNSCYLQKFKLYQTHSNFYMVGRDKNRSFWKVLKISREESPELNILEDPETYTAYECADLLKRISEGNKSCGGLKFVTNCYGIIGLTKLLGPYYMLLITKRRKIGDICGHTIYSITKRELIPIPNNTVLSKMDISNDENRYKKLLCSVDLTKDFFFSYSYHVMCSLQKNLRDNETGLFLYDTMFVWNEYLTREIRQNLKNTRWTVALVHGFFKQVKLSVSEKDFKLTLIARRSRHYAGTRYLKRGVNARGRVANDVETEQIVCEDIPEGCLMQMSSVVQNRGSIPLFWSQETSRLNLRPDIILSKKDPKYEATKLHFENLAKRYGNPIIILNLIKTREKKPRESILCIEFANAVRSINKVLQGETRLKFLHWDLSKHSRNKATHVLKLLGELSTKALSQMGIFYCQVATYPQPGGAFASSLLKKFDNSNGTSLEENPKNKDSEQSEIDVGDFQHDARGFSSVKPPMFQTGVLRTNCIDCLDRTNVAQYAYGLVALGTQLHALGFTPTAKIDLDNPLAEELMRAYEAMGDTLALQYGGSAAHNKIFSERRGQWKAATQSQEFLRTLQRYYSNAYMDTEKQNAINVFLGYFQPQQGKPAIWELNSDQYHNLGSSAGYADENAWSFIKRSFSDGSMLPESESTISPKNLVQNKPLPQRDQGTNKGLSDSSPEIIPCENDISYHRHTPSIACTQISRVVEDDEWAESGRICYDEHGDACSFSNFDLDWLSSSGNSCEEEFNDRSSIIGALTENSVGREINEITATPSEAGSSFKGKEQMESEHLDGGNAAEFSSNFVQWVANGGLLFY